MMLRSMSGMLSKPAEDDCSDGCSSPGDKWQECAHLVSKKLDVVLNSARDRKV